MVKRISKRLSLEPDEEEKKAQKAAKDELELRTLVKKNRMIKDVSTRDAHSEKQRKVVNVLANEKRSLVNSLNLLTSRRRCLLDIKQSQEISELFTLGDNLDAEIAQEKKYIKDLEAQIQKDLQNIHDFKENMKGNAVLHSEFQVKEEKERQDRTLESWNSRLAAEQRQLALVLKSNTDLRKKVELLLKEKGQFNKLFEELIEKLKRGKVIMADVFEQSKTQFQKKDEVVRKIEALKERDKEDLVKKMEEIQDLEMKLFEDAKLSDFRNKVRLAREKFENYIRTSKKDGILLKKQTLRMQEAMELSTAIKEATGHDNDEDVREAIIKEEANLFSLFCFNNEIRDQLEVMTQKAAVLLRTVDDEQSAAEDWLNRNFKRQQVMRNKLHGLEQNVNDITENCNANTRVFSRLLSKIKLLFDMMKCNSSPLKDLLGNNTEVTDFNYRLYLCLIETSVIGMLDFLAPTVQEPKGDSKTSKTTTVASPSRTGTTYNRVLIADKKVVTRPCLECDGAKVMTHHYGK